MTKQGKKVQEKIVQELTAKQLKHQIQRLRQLPKDFRDTLGDGKDWDDFAEITGRRTEMEEWLHGPVLCLAVLNEQEKTFFRSSVQVTVFDSEGYVLNVYDLLDFIKRAEARGYSFIYLPMFEQGVAYAFNTILSATGANLRVRGQLRDSKGRALGVVH